MWGFVWGVGAPMGCGGSYGVWGLLWGVGVSQHLGGLLWAGGSDVAVRRRGARRAV